MSDYSIFLEVNGTKVHGFTAGRVIWRVEALCGTFALQSRATAQELPSVVKLGAECTLWVQGPAGQQKALVGVIDNISHEITEDTVQTAVSGRSTSADLVDCAAPLQAWQNQTALQIAHALCEPYGIKVADEADLSEVFDNFASQPGETVAKALLRLARLRGVWIGDAAPDGTLRFFEPGKKHAPYQLDLGEHLVRVRAYEDRAQRFGRVQVLGETPAGEVLKAEAEDGGGGRKRQHIFLSEDPALPNAMQARANWERGLELADSTGALLEIHRWDILPSLLPVGGLVRVNAAKVGMQGMVLVQGVDIYLDENGPRLRLDVTHPAAPVSPANRQRANTALANKGGIA